MLKVLSYVNVASWAQIRRVEEEPKAKAVIPAPLLPLLDGYQAVFGKVEGLPPTRAHDHKILLEDCTSPINIRPYKHSPLQKDVIEQMVKELLDSGTIKHSVSPYSSPVILVKKDNGWRMCADYRELNKKTIKDRFPIPNIEELFDELYQANVFSKLDLASGYYQILMNPADTPKTAFRTHEGHYEFLVMPFGLTNAPSTFQIMNDIFRPLLRKSVLVFFDDILIYSESMEQHVGPLKEVLSLLHKHKLVAKMSKCRFGHSKVEYLGHVIEAG